LDKINDVALRLSHVILADLLRQSVYSRLAGYEDLHDAERLAAAPMFRLISLQRILDRTARMAIKSFDAVPRMKKLGVDPQRV
jgi:hypothetical protein